MKVTLSRQGGLAAGLRLNQPAAQLDTSAWPAEDVTRLDGLLTAAEAAPAPAAANVRDGMSYTVTAERGEQHTTLKASDAAMSPEFAELLAWLGPRMPE